MSRGMVNVDGHFRTNIPSVFAIGDCIDGPMLVRGRAAKAKNLVDLRRLDGF